MEDLTTKLIGSIQLTENDVISHAADIFRPIAQEVSMIDGHTTSHRPINLSQYGPFEFELPPIENQYLHLSKTRLYMKLKVLKDDGSVITDADNVSISNLVGSSMFKTLEIKINGKSISDLTNTHFHYKTYLETILSYSFSARNTHLQASQLSLDVASAFDDMATGVDDAHKNNNSGFMERKSVIAGSSEFDVMFPLHSDFLQSDRLFPPKATVNIKLTREHDNFILLSDSTTKKYKIEIIDMKLYIRRLTIANNIRASHDAAWNAKKPIILPINKSEMKAFTFTAGLATASIPNLFNGILPKSIIFGMLDNTAYNGVLGKNPYNFKHFDVNYISLRYNGELIPAEPYTPNFEKNLYHREYRDFFDNLGIHHDDVGNAVTKKYYKGGMTLFAFDFSPDLCNSFHSHPTKTGTIDLELKFTKVLPAVITVLVFASYNAILSLNKDNVVEVAV
jgi:hypothetical protein